MGRVDSLWFTLISEVLINLSAGWLAIAIATPFSPESNLFIKIAALTAHIGFAIVSLLAAFWLRKRGAKR